METRHYTPPAYVPGEAGFQAAIDRLKARGILPAAKVDGIRRFHAQAQETQTPDRHTADGRGQLHDNRRRRVYTCPTCKTAAALTGADVLKGYQCERCTRHDEGPL